MYKYIEEMERLNFMDRVSNLFVKDSNVNLLQIALKVSNNYMGCIKIWLNFAEQCIFIHIFPPKVRRSSEQFIQRIIGILFLICSTLTGFACADNLLIIFN